MERTSRRLLLVQILSHGELRHNGIVAKWMAASYRNIIIDSSDQLKLLGENHKEDTTYLPDKHKYPPPAPHQNYKDIRDMESNEWKGH